MTAHNEVEVVAWQKLTSIGQLKAGMPIRFVMNDVDIETDVKEVLFAGTENEEIVYNRKKNHYFMVSMVLNNTSYAKEVEYQQANTTTIPTSEYEKLKLDAERYRWLREQSWVNSNLIVVFGGKDRLKLGTDCPSLMRLDQAIDQAKESA